MKKIFSFVIVAFAAIALNAAEAVFDFTKPASLNPAVTPSETKSTGVQIGGQSFTAGDVTIAFAEPSSNGAKLFTKSDGASYELRFYQPNSFTISSKGENISKVQFVFGGQKGGIVPASGEIDATGAWLGNAKEITFSVPEKGQASYISSITVYVGEAPIVKIDTLNVGEMIALIDAAPGKKLSKQAYVIGRVGSMYTGSIGQYGNINVWLGDIRTSNATDTIEAYGMLNYDGAKYKEEEEIQFGMGDTIVVYSASWEYFADEKNQQYEASKGCFLAEVVGPGNPKPIVYDQITVEDALEIAMGLTPAVGETAKTTVKYDVRGYVVSISKEKGLESIYLADDPDAWGDFQAYKCEIAEGATVEEGAYVSVIGYISTYHGTGSKGEYYNYEVAYGKLTVLEEPTALPTVIANKVSCKKMMINGQMYIKKDNKLYSVLGQAL